MTEISKIVINGTSGYCCAEESYSDKVTVTKESIAYEYHPIFETDINPSRKWSYKTNSPVFEKLYADLIDVIPVIVNHDKDIFCTDIGGIEFIITYSDKTKFKEIFFLPGDEFKECFQIIKRMVPECEYVPAVLITEDDFED
ncbi:hypothetical protein [Clostridium grantii]|uniref:Uncharacterized protein n=1 Tax=Clostridium grantii DSM 8605 TaxID=1121316 RepID=A0A1M5XWV9_9CLOT|nr:hypothetical protein [Clostridium grantii]SHI03723.1 hypothetical protein SAMN02745207_03961 [Clostridium grantii DSM 8605]